MNNRKPIPKNQGFVTRIVLVIVAIIAIKYYYHFDTIEFIKSDKVQAVIQPIIHNVVTFYNWLDNLVKGWVS